MGFEFKISWGKDKRSINDPLNYQAQNPEHPSSNPNRWLLDIFNARPTSSGVRVDPETAPGFSAVYRCVSLISSTMAMLPQHIYKIGEDGKSKQPDHYVAKVLRKPSEIYNRYIWKENMMQFSLLWGNGYSEIIRDERFIVKGFRLFHSKDVRPFIAITASGEEALFYEVTTHFPNGTTKKRTIAAMDMFHIPCLSFDGIAGKSPVTVARENIGLGLAAEKFAGDFYKNDAAYSGVYQHPGALSDEAYHRLKNSLDGHSQYGEKNKTLLLEGGTTYNPITMPMRDAQFIESRKFQIEEIARMYGVPLHKLANLDRSTNNNIEQQALEFISDTMLSWAEKWEAEIDDKLLLEKDKGKYFARFDFNEITRGDSTQRGNWYGKMFGIGAMSRNEIRAAEDLPPVENGDKYMIPLNMADAAKEEPGEPSNPKEDGEGNENLPGGD